MFKSFASRSKKDTNNSEVNAPIDATMDTTDDSFIHIDDSLNQPSLSLKVSPRHNLIGVSAPNKATEFCATITARDLPEDDESTRAPVDIVVVLDVSGSMDGSKLDLCKTTLRLLLRELSSSDRFGLITFGSDVKLEIPSRKLSQTNRDYAMAKIKGLTTRGCTNLTGGIGMGAQEIKSIESPHEVRTIFLLTDGQANVGISDREGIVELTKGCLGTSHGQNPIPIHCFGYGKDHDREVLRDISMTIEGGTYYYVENDFDVSSAFGDALGGVLSVVAQNTVVSLKVPQESSGNGVSILKVNHEKAVKNLDGTYSVSLGDFYAEESRDIVFEVSLSSECNSEQVVHVASSMSFLDTINSKLVQTENSLGCISRPIGIEVSPSDPHISLQCIRIRTTEVMSKAETMANSGQLDTAKKMITFYIEELQKEASGLDASNPFIDQMMNELNTILASLSSRTMYEAQGSRYISQKIMMHQQQRSCEANEESLNVYKSSKKQMRSRKMKKASLNYMRNK
jgi:Mg-chelatase subunit ChlD